MLVGGSGPTDRDETVAGIPIFGQLASALADAGFLVLRYDKRGVGQSGGRPEAATLADYADDLRAAVRSLGGRKDVDRRRIAVVGYGEGGPVALIAASKEDRIAALVLVATIGTHRRRANLAQVTRRSSDRRAPTRTSRPPIALQKKIQKAVLTGQGLGRRSPPSSGDRPTRRGSRASWRSTRRRIMRDVEQPLLIVHGELDPQVPPSNADRLEQLARARRRGSVEVVRVPGVNHLLVPATTGEIDEYGTLTDRTVSPAVTGALADLAAEDARPPPLADSRMWILHAADPKLDRLRFASRRAAIKTVGRAPRADFIVDAALVSRLHCRLEAGLDNLEVIDLASTNGTFVNDKRIERARLTSGDRLRIGRVELKVETDVNA